MTSQEIDRIEHSIPRSKDMILHGQAKGEGTIINGQARILCLDPGTSNHNKELIQLHSVTVMVFVVTVTSMDWRLCCPMDIL